MATLRQLAEQVIEAYGKPYDSVLYERAKDLILNTRATLIRQSFERTGIDDIFIIPFVFELIEVDIIDNCQVQLDCIILRSKNKIPEPVRFKNDIPFTFLGTADGTRTFSYIKSFQVPLIKHLKFGYKKISAFYINQYIYIINTKILQWARADAPYSFPNQLIPGCGSDDCFNDDMEFACPADIINTILKEVITSKVLLITNNEESTVPINKENV